ncbi:MAG: tetratricopeptide repeat protein, partial [Gemmatimonadota bacterium]|nr:tetratricopeptide repeat protein [Gemmatimonadota bacterium]
MSRTAVGLSDLGLSGLGLSGLGLAIAALTIAALGFAGCGAKTMQYSGSLDTPEVEYAKALSLLESGAHDEAEAALRRTMRLDDGYAPAYVGMSRLLLELGDVKEAIRYVHMARIRDVD